MSLREFATSCLLAAVCLLSSDVHGETAIAIKGYIRRVPRETTVDREARHEKIAERRSAALIIVHRGASAFAPENTLEAYAAAMDYGADGCEVDLRRTLDGVLVLFHDDMLDHLTDGFGTVSQLTYYELLSLTPRFRYGTAGAATRPPTFAALLTLARQRAMLLHLDVKEPNLDNEIANFLDEADAWDHIVAVNSANAPNLLRNPKLKLLKYKVPGLYAERRDVDALAVRDSLLHPGEMIMVDDPRVAARELRRPPYQPTSLLANLREKWQPSVAVFSEKSETFVPSFYLRTKLTRINPNSGQELTELVKSGDQAERVQTEGNEEYRRGRVAKIVERAWAAQRLGQIARKSPELVQLLQSEVEHRSLHKDWIYQGLDGAMAVRALGLLKATESVPFLIEQFKRVDADLAKVANPEFAQNPLSWTDWRLKMYIIPALGELPCKASKAFLLEYLAMSEGAARELSPPQFEEATKALFRQKLTEQELKTLLRSAHSSVRGTAVLECVDHPSLDRTAALREVAPSVSRAAEGEAMIAERACCFDLQPEIQRLKLAQFSNHEWTPMNTNSSSSPSPAG